MEKLNRIISILHKVILVCTALMAVAVLMIMAMIPGGSVLLIVSGMLAACCCSLLGTAIFVPEIVNREPAKGNGAIAFIGLSIEFVELIFVLQNYPGSRVMAVLGLLGWSIGTCVWMALIIRMKKEDTSKEEALQSALKDNLILIVGTLVCFATFTLLLAPRSKVNRFIRLNPLFLSEEQLHERTVSQENQIRYYLWEGDTLQAKQLLMQEIEYNRQRADDEKFGYQHDEYLHTVDNYKFLGFSLGLLEGEESPIAPYDEELEIVEFDDETE